jgi:hypothetical protein
MLNVRRRVTAGLIGTAVLVGSAVGLAGTAYAAGSGVGSGSGSGASQGPAGLLAGVPVLGDPKSSAVGGPMLPAG